MKQEYWNTTKEIIKPVYFDENNFSIEERNALEQAFTDLKRKVEREITLHAAKGLIVTRDYVSNILDHFFNKANRKSFKSLMMVITSRCNSPLFQS